MLRENEVPLIFENSLEVEKSQNATPRFLLMGIFCVFYLLVALLGPINIFEGELLGTDSYTRLNRVLFVHDQGQWNNSIYPRSNAPYGESIHWTKPMDLLLLAGGSILGLMMPFSTGLHLWGVVISPLLHVVAFMGIFYLMQKHLDRLGMILLAIVFLLQPILTSYFMIGRPDHHSLILAVFCWFLVGLYRGTSAMPNWNQFFFIGVMGALGLWISVEFLVPIGLFLMASTVFWIWRGERNAFFISRVMTAMFLLATLFLFVERVADDLFIIEFDKISLPHCVLLGFIAMVWFGINELDPHSSWTSSILRRMLLIGALSLVASVVQWSLFPNFFRGPLVGIDPTLKQVLWSNVAETQPLQSSEAIMNLGMGILVFPSLAYSMSRTNAALKQYQGILLLVGASVFIPLAMYESRWAPYASIVLIIPYIAFVRRFLGWVETRWPDRRGELVSLMIGLFLLFWPVTVGTVMALDDPKTEVSTMDGKCPLKPLGDYLTIDDSWVGTSQTILAFQDFGPELLYRTSHRVIGTPMHRNHEGMSDLLTIMTAKDFKIPHKIVQRRNINLIIVCVNSKAESQFFNNTSDKNRVYGYLTNGMIPSWLHEVQLPEDLIDSFRLFEVTQPSHEMSLAEKMNFHVKLPSNP